MMLARSSSRGAHVVRVLAVHTTEGGGTAEALRDAAWWVGSAHAIADKRGVLLTPAQGCVPYERASWTLRSGNPWSENIELVGYARYTRQQWLDQPALLQACARWLADRSKARGIPLVKLSPAQYRAGGRGVIGHIDHTIGYADGTHWDPGPGFPFDVVLAAARDYTDGVEIDPVPDVQEDDMLAITTADTKRVYVKDGEDLWHTGDPVLASVVAKVRAVTLNQREVDVLLSDVNRRRTARLAAITRAASGDAADLEQLVRELVADLAGPLADAIAAKSGPGGLSREDVQDAVREVLRTGVDTAA